MRINKYLANTGIASRRKSELLILQEKVKVNSKIITDLSFQVDMENDIVQVDNQVVFPNIDEKIYIVTHKPRGYLSTVSDPLERKTVLDLVPRYKQRLFPVGRLDYLSEGLLILTNDGDFTQSIIHPSKKVKKIYRVKVFGAVSSGILKKLKQGFRDGRENISALDVKVIKFLNKKTWLEFTLIEGKNRQIRRLCSHFNLTIDKLKRVSIGGLSVYGISPGNHKLFNKKELLSKIFCEEITGAQPSTKQVRIKQGHLKNKTPATEKKFIKYRKQYYYKTLSNTKKKKDD